MAAGMERRDDLENPSVDLVAALTAIDELGAYTPAGIAITPTRAIRHVAVYACIRVIAETIASLPFPVLAQQGRTRVEVRDDPRWQLLNVAPNPEMTAMEWLEGVIAYPNLYSRSYSLIERDNGGRPIAIWPLRSDRTRRYRMPDRTLRYATTLDTGEPAFLEGRDVIDVPHFLGLAPIEQARNAIATAMAAEEYAGRFWSNDARPGGIIEVEDEMDENEVAEFKRRWDAGHRGLRRSHLIGILQGGAKWTDVGIPPEQSQFLQSRLYGVTEIARLFRVPPYMIADLQPGSVSYASVEQQSIDFLIHCLRPWIRRVTQQINLKLFNEPEDIKHNVFCDFKTKQLLLGDIKTRGLYFGHAIQYGWMSPADVREEDDYPFVEGLDTYYEPLNQLPVAATQGTPGSELIEQPDDIERYLMYQHNFRRRMRAPRDLLADQIAWEDQNAIALQERRAHARGLAANGNGR